MKRISPGESTTLDLYVTCSLCGKPLTKPFSCLMWDRCSTCTVIALKVNPEFSGQSLYFINKKQAIISKHQVQKLCRSALISLSDMETTIVLNASWKASLKERDQTPKTSLSLWGQRPGHSWPKHTATCCTLTCSLCQLAFFLLPFSPYHLVFSLY